MFPMLGLSFLRRVSSVFFLAEYAKSSESLANIPLENGRGLSMNGVDMVNIARATSSQLNNAELSDELGLQVVKNLLHGEMFLC